MSRSASQTTYPTQPRQLRIPFCVAAECHLIGSLAPARSRRAPFTVEAGGWRLRALNELVVDGKLDAAHEVPCLVIGGGADNEVLEQTARLNVGF
jgi:hypothetical protein